MAGQTVIVLDQGFPLADQLSADEERSNRDVWLDLANIEAIDSADLSALIRFSLRMRQLDRSVFLCHVGQHLKEIFEITRFQAAGVY
jgi:anti-anti-sigma regulatory factor